VWCVKLLPPKSALRNYSRLKVPWEIPLPPEYIYLRALQNYSWRRLPPYSPSKEIVGLPAHKLLSQSLKKDHTQAFRKEISKLVV
jgi:hypothetical protein